MQTPKEKKQELQKIKEFFTVKIETLAPVTLTYRVYAESAEQAIDFAAKLAGQQQASPPIISFAKIKLLKAKAYMAGTSLIKSIKNFT